VRNFTSFLHKYQPIFHHNNFIEEIKGHLMRNLIYKSVFYNASYDFIGIQNRIKLNPKLPFTYIVKFLHPLLVTRNILLQGTFTY